MDCKDLRLQLWFSTNLDLDILFYFLIDYSQNGECHASVGTSYSVRTGLSDKRFPPLPTTRVDMLSVSPLTSISVVAALIFTVEH